MANKSKAEMLDSLRVLLREVLSLRSAGSTHPRLSRASGVADGYMRALLDSGLASQRELLGVVADERRAAGGPSTGPLPSDPAILAA
jgi:hypothetical protein